MRWGVCPWWCTWEAWDTIREPVGETAPSLLRSTALASSRRRLIPRLQTMPGLKRRAEEPVHPGDLKLQACGKECWGDGFGLCGLS